MGNVSLSEQKKYGSCLTKFQKSKLVFDFETFFDLNKDGVLSHQDFMWSKDQICYMSGWKIGSRAYSKTEQLFKEIWSSLEEVADSDHDGKITKIEWITMWENYKKELVEQHGEDEDFLRDFHRLKSRENNIELHKYGKYSTKNYGNGGLSQNERLLNDMDENDKFLYKKYTVLPPWLYDYLVFRFNLLDRTGDGEIDIEEYEYILSQFGISEKDCRQCFHIISGNFGIILDFDYFVRLFEEYYLSEDPAALGNFVNGHLEYADGNGKHRVVHQREEDDDKIAKYLQNNLEF